MIDELIEGTETLRDEVDKLTFAEPITHVYNPLNYAWAAHKQYLEKYANSQKRVLFLGMNPGPWGMAQTAVPFGEITAVRDFLKIDAPIGKPRVEHPKRLIVGLECERSEVSGARLWGLMREKFKTAKDFSKDYFVANYCPLVFMEQSGKNFTPDKLPASEYKELTQKCDEYLRTLVRLLQPEWVVGVGKFAERRAKLALEETDFSGQIGTVLHPSPASPAANKGWAEKATLQLIDLGIFSE
jgi:single-strand selective monofunctional uracil DNA glycosylase